MHKISFVDTHPGIQSWELDWECNKVFWGNTGLCCFENRAEGTVTRIPVLNHSPTLPREAIFPKENIPLICINLQGKAQAPPTSCNVTLWSLNPVEGSSACAFGIDFLEGILRTKSGTIRVELCGSGEERNFLPHPPEARGAQISAMARLPHSLQS